MKLVIAVVVTSMVGFWVGQGRFGTDPSSLTSDTLSASLSAALREEDSLIRWSETARISASVTPDNLPGLILATEENLASLAQPEIEMIAEAWAAIEPDGAFELSLSWIGSGRRSALLSAIAYSWARTDPVSCERAVREITDVHLQEPAAAGLARGWARSGKDGLLGFLDGLPKSQFRQMTVRSVLEEILEESGRDGVVKWTDRSIREASGKLPTTVLRKAAMVLGRDDSLATLPWIDSTALLPEADGIERIFVMQWILFDPHAALGWLGTREAMPKFDETVVSVLRRWHDRDSESAREWFGDHRTEAWLGSATTGPWALGGALDGPRADG